MYLPQIRQPLWLIKWHRVIDLNIDDPNSEEQDYTIDDLVAYTKTYDSAVNINLKKDAGDDSNHYARLPVLQFLLTAKPMIIKR